jgi:diguanylate cyclase (GGDEF)-like protein
MPKDPPKSAFWKLISSVFHWLTDAPVTLSEPDRRRRRVLAWMLITLILLVSVALILVLVFDTTDPARRDLYIALISGLLVALGVAFSMNQHGRYIPAAMLTVICAFLGPWGSLLLDPSVLHGDFVPLTYLVLSVMLASILLSARATIFLSGIQFIILLFLPRFIPATAAIDWPSFLAFIFFTAMLGVVSNLIHHQDLAQIDQQTLLLQESEANLRELSVRDSLTGLFNRRYMEETLDRELRRAERKALPLGIIMIDIDHFKKFNDTYGHPAGDAMLRQLGFFLKAHIRISDIACRYGGEEFILILPEASLETTRERAEQVRLDTKQLAVYYEGRPLEPVTLSLGVAAFPDHSSNRTAILKAADGALYAAKNAGRARVAVAEL